MSQNRPNHRLEGAVVGVTMVFAFALTTASNAPATESKGFELIPFAAADGGAPALRRKLLELRISRRPEAPTELAALLPQALASGSPELSLLGLLAAEAHRESDAVVNVLLLAFTGELPVSPAFGRPESPALDELNRARAALLLGASGHPRAELALSARALGPGGLDPLGKLLARRALGLPNEGRVRTRGGVDAGPAQLDLASAEKEPSAGRKASTSRALELFRRGPKGERNLWARTLAGRVSTSGPGPTPALVESWLVSSNEEMRRQVVFGLAEPELFADRETRSELRTRGLRRTLLERAYARETSTPMRRAICLAWFVLDRAERESSPESRVGGSRSGAPSTSDYARLEPDRLSRLALLGRIDRKVVERAPEWTDAAEIAFAGLATSSATAR